MAVTHSQARGAKHVYFTGYDPYSNPPNYGNADDVVKENTNKVSREKGSPRRELLFRTYDFIRVSRDDPGDVSKLET